ncbi:peptidase S8 [Sphaerisporangium krabiense]|uniref:Type VII secretion-associated serine protease mycosin n=1 Tax=Sphaerisporangium krabiense TaxID=763782 RepID=A0A7W8Z7J3_9ACTN|nr:S8 family serine peptidase [Sphaerisporangium krabiense]MBB5628790.1 type VII secretion-associated serine protease mycosin [Sphaerisporangium krabiense]GII60368.1 peptidase S8 [Sphaerisporangium krabiense]
MAGRGVVAVALAFTLAAGPSTAAAAVEPQRCAPPRGGVEVGESWAQRRLAFTRVWQLTRGEGVTVAFVDSGADTRHPQVRVARTVDLTGTGPLDCVGHGTAVAGIIGGADMKDIPFAGVAPEARLVSIKQSNAENGDVALLAEGIRRAADLGAQVLNISIQTGDQPVLKSAVEYALANDVVIVAAAGNIRKEDGTPAPSYPAAYEGVLAVGSAGPDGRRTDFSNAATPVSVLAPGAGITSTWPGGAYRQDLDGTSYAAPYVAGVAALVRARHPELDNVRVRRRIELTADGASGAGTGAGMVNPLLAVSQILPSEVVALAPARPAPLPSGVVARPVPPDTAAMTRAGGIALAALLAAGLVTAVSVVIPLGRRRGWRPGRAAVPGD